MSQYNTSKCIFPDGVTNGNINPPFVPCDPLASVSACCAIGESCVGEGLCYSANGGIYRGACTDATWKDPACPKYCVAKSGDQASTYETGTKDMSKECLMHQASACSTHFADLCYLLRRLPKCFPILISMPHRWRHHSVVLLERQYMRQGKPFRAVSPRHPATQYLRASRQRS